jgi:hypothetical protein
MSPQLVTNFGGPPHGGPLFFHPHRWHEKRDDSIGGDRRLGGSDAVASAVVIEISTPGAK